MIYGPAFQFQNYLRGLTPDEHRRRFQPREGPSVGAYSVIVESLRTFVWSSSGERGSDITITIEPPITGCIAVILVW